MAQIILVNSNDEPMGTVEKLKAHQEGLLHRAFSLFLYRINPHKQIEILLQQRNPKKYHSGGLWTNTCCSHPAPGETLEDAVIRRVNEELGIQLFQHNLQKAGVFHYTAAVGNNLIENEIDHVFVAKLPFDENFECQFDDDEISQTTWMTFEDLKKNITIFPEKYTAWLGKALAIAEKFL